MYTRKRLSTFDPFQPMENRKQGRGKTETDLEEGLSQNIQLRETRLQPSNITILTVIFLKKQNKKKLINSCVCVSST